MKIYTYFCYYELYVDDRTFCIYVLIDAKNVRDALSKLESQHGESYHLQGKGCFGEFTEELAKKYMRQDEII